MAKTRKSNKKKSGFLLVCFWFLVLILIIAVFFVKRNEIKKNLQDTDFIARISGKTPSTVVEKENNETKSPSVQESISIDVLEATGTEANNKKTSETENPKVTENKNVKTPETEPEKPLEPVAPKEKTNASAKEKKQPEKIIVPKKTEVTLYFIGINSDGSVTRKASKRSLSKSDSPLTDSINALLAGPTADELSKDMMTLIPSGTKLLGASVKNGIATLNFNENFQFNSVGVEGYIAQLMQIVYTATEFSTVRNVQFLIEGEKRDYLGSEGQWIGSPLARSSF